MTIKGVVGTATGIDGTGQPVVTVFAEQPGVAGIPRNVEGVPVVVEVTGKIFALGKPQRAAGGRKGEQVDRTARFDRPVPIGVSTGHPSITAGTIGCRVIDLEGHVYALSNNHVYAAENQAETDDNVLQPGTYDGGVDPDDAIGTLSDYEPIVFGDGANVIDAAIALSSTAQLGNATPSDGYGTPRSTTAEATINQKVKKYGRTSGQTKGVVWAINATIEVGYSNNNTALFVGQIVVHGNIGFIQGGDSGSLLVLDGKGKGSVDDRKPVGLLFAGTPLGDYGIANSIDAVLARFGVAVDGN